MKGSPSRWLAAVLALAVLVVAALLVLGGDDATGGAGRRGRPSDVANRPVPRTEASAVEASGESAAAPRASNPEGQPTDETGSARRSASPVDPDTQRVVVHFAGEIQGKDTHAPLEGVRVTVSCGERRLEAVTDALGRFALEVAGATADVVLEHARYVDRALPDLDLTAPARFELVPSATLIGWIRPVTPEVEVLVWHQAASGERFWTEHRPEVDESGRFELTDLAPGQYLATSRSPDGSSAREAGIQLAPGETKTLSLEASGGAEVRGRITRRGAGTVVMGATLRFEPRGDFPRVLRNAGRRYAVSGGDGRYALQALTPGTYRVEVAAEGFGPQSFMLDVPASGERIERDVELAGAGTILGQVVDALGAPVAGVALRLWDKDSRSLDDDQQPPNATSASDGSFRIDGVAPGGKITLVGVPPSGAPIGTLRLAGPPADGVRSGVRLELPASGSIRGLVQDENGLPVGGARIQARSLAVSSLRIAETSSDEEGRFELASMPTGRLRVSAEARDHLDARATITVTEAEAAECTLVLEATHVLAGFVLDADGAGIPGLPVRVKEIGGATLVQEGDDKPFEALTRSDAFGGFAFKALPARIFAVNAGSYEWEQVASDPDEVHVPADETVVLRVEPRQRSERFAITGVVTLADRQPPTELRIRGLAGGVLEIDGGEFRATGLTPSRQTLWIARDGYATERVGPIEPLPGGVVDVGWIELHPATLLTVQLLDAAKKPVRGARVVLEPLPVERGGLGTEARTIVLSEAKNGRYRAWVRPFVWRVRAEAKQGKSSKTVRVKAQEKQGLTLRF